MIIHKKSNCSSVANRYLFCVCQIGTFLADYFILKEVIFMEEILKKILEEQKKQTELLQKIENYLKPIVLMDDQGNMI